MAYDPRNVKYPPNHTLQRPNVVGYNYSGHPPQHFQQTDENRNENNNLRSSKELCPQISQQSSNTQTVQKVDAATMTDPLQIDFRLSECLARCSSTLGLPYATKYEDCGTNSTYQEVRAKIEFDIEPQHINGMLVYHCPECAYRFNDREALHEHLEDHKQRPHICDICGASLKRKEHLDRHKQGHNKDRPYQCNMCCKAFKRNEHLARHMITHSGSKNQICTECGKAFYRKDHLKKHLQSHNSSRGKHLNISHNNPNDQQPSDQGLSNFAMMMRQSGPPALSILRT
ncbi:Zinc finger and SCAN domain-containing protein 10 [Atta colombica]|uniref:Zinc finger and SCAN domain-containing protein 10 n=1 Tax=Atta colombica TaxID=520822 RepID=A0A195B554_9HYME|nr:PREDICTED: zinc finger protein 16-like [Atta colombica]XP_018052568.1 PREDICTED: zinc finger protein 16-like [Atta colombica]KYM79633.1 Zinc finger and SCAN domain-containing protein 10 [Atta colombica]